LLAGLIFEKAADQAIEKFLRDSLLEVHGLNQTYFPIFESLPSDVARPWSNNQPIGNIPRTSLLSAAWTAGAMYSNAEDMNSWYRDLFDGKILLPTSMSEMLAFTGSARYGLGIQKVEIGGRTCYAHGGSIRGYRSFMLYDEATGAVISVLINENPASPNLVAEALLLTLTEAFSGVSVHDKMAGGGVDIYPNPTTGRIVLKPSGGEGSDVFSLVRSVSIFDQQGRLVIQQDNPDLELEVGGLARGVYWVKIQFDHGPLSRKIFVR
jgi:CubicO group peptidase (beta-lactamase class C family)